ncbi:hypothetical protein FM114_11460 [Luteococcus japonicus LSP_Lj1]|uniref:Uncharacterized protein n=1 Tax=Luteococcus japonicus LSP_Lj1 TaxID=1255658 RepID=A0A1R4K5E5_9ACTN|nr:hypothetical protein FM114_11460 [Luteococcus japonicus LSP_Lj1]
MVPTLAARLPQPQALIHDVRSSITMWMLSWLFRTPGCRNLNCVPAARGAKDRVDPGPAPRIRAYLACFPKESLSQENFWKRAAWAALRPSILLPLRAALETSSACTSCRPMGEWSPRGHHPSVPLRRRGTTAPAPSARHAASCSR